MRSLLLSGTKIKLCALDFVTAWTAALPPRRPIPAQGDAPGRNTNQRTRVGIACDADLEAERLCRRAV